MIAPEERSRPARGVDGGGRSASAAVVRVWVITALLLAGGAQSAVESAAQERCPGGRVSDIEITSQDPYDAETADDEGPVGWVFRQLNWIHFETKERIIRWELLFSEGSCFDPRLLSESERRLRSLRFIAEASVESRELPDGSRRVQVVTRDRWALSVGVDISVEEELAFNGIQVSNRNVLGYGLRLGLFRRSFRERKRQGLLARHPNVFGTAVSATVHGGDTRSGPYFSQTLYRPFPSELADDGFRQVLAWRDDFFAYAVPPGRGYREVYLRHEVEHRELTYQRRFGADAGPRWVVGLGVSQETFRTPFGPEGVRVVDTDFDDPVPAVPGLRDALLPQIRPFATTRVMLSVGLRDAFFITRRGVDAITGVQDLFVGRSLILATAPGFAIRSDDRSDLLTRLQAKLGLAGADSYLLTRLDVQARRDSDPLNQVSGWRDWLGELRADGYWRTAPWASVYGRAQLMGGWRTDRPFQLTLGGREAVRAYSEDAFPGGRLLLLSLEQRLDLHDLGPDFLDLGVAAFADAARGWAGDAPFGSASGWQAGVGVGVRMAPEGSRRVFRVDATLPLTEQRDVRGVRFRIYSEIFGVLDRRRWPGQVDRSRWYGADPDLSTRVPDPLARN